MEIHLRKFYALEELSVKYYLYVGTMDINSLTRNYSLKRLVFLLFLSKFLSEIKEIYSLSRVKIENDTSLKQFLKTLDICEESLDQNLKKMKKE